MLGHVDAASAEADPFRFQPETLLDTRIALQLDLTSSSDHTLPRKSKGCMQDPDHLASRPGVTRSSRDCPVGGNFPSGNTADCLRDPLTHAALP